MYQIPQYKTSVVMFSVDGGVRIFRSPAEAVRQLGHRWISENVGPEFRVFSHTESFRGETRRIYLESRYVMRDDFGNRLTSADFTTLHRKPDFWSRWRGPALSRWNGDGPVPFTGKSSGGYCFRRPQTMQERRWGQAADTDDIAPRARRNPANLPNAWDDEQISARGNRSWKSFRRYQCRARQTGE
jgi:hypothetical protein